MAAIPILVTGGCGFLGFHLVQELLKDPQCTSITVISRDPTQNRFDGVDYRPCDLTDATLLSQIVNDVKPRVIFHVASPKPMDGKLQQNDWHNAAINGTKNLIEVAENCSSTEILIYTSSVNVIQGREHVNVKEDAYPYWNLDSKDAIPYWRTKAQAEKIVLAADSDKLKTISMRLCLIIGIQEHAYIPHQITAFEEGKTKIQLGDNKNLLDTVSAENSAHALLLAMRALLDPSKAQGKIHGEAFNITDGNPLPFWNLARMTWRAAGDKTELGDVRVIPAWTAHGMARLGEFFSSFMFWSDKTPELNSHVVNFCTSTYTYDISKAKRMLGYNPVAQTEQVLKEAVEWEMNRRAQETCKIESDEGM
jgi:sterol-4alpha-carboxylate 3-dehydrogenase (decarboxylating)